MEGHRTKFDKMTIKSYPVCPTHASSNEIANIICIDPNQNSKNKNQFKILCPECQNSNGTTQSRSIGAFLNHVVNKCNDVGENTYTHEAITGLMYQSIAEIQKIIQKLEEIIEQIKEQQLEIEAVFERKDDTKSSIGDHLDTIRNGQTDDYDLMQNTIKELAQYLRFETSKKEWIVDIQKYQKEWNDLDAKVNAKYKQYQTVTHNINTDIAKFLNQKPPAKPKQDGGIVTEGKAFRQTQQNPKQNNLYLADIPADSKKKFVIRNNSGFMGLGIATQEAINQLGGGLDPNNTLRDLEGIYLAGSNEQTYGRCNDADMEGLKLLKDWCVEVYIKSNKLTIKTVKNPVSGDYVAGSKAKNCQISIDIGDKIDEYRMVACITGKDDCIEEVS